MDCPSLLGRTLNGLTITVQSLNGVNCFCLSVWLPAFFDSPAAFYLFVSARICSLSPPPPPQTPNPSALLEKTLHFMSLAPPHLSDKELVTLRPKQEVQLVISFWHETCVTLIRCSVFLFLFYFCIYNCTTRSWKTGVSSRARGKSYIFLQST